MAKLSFNAAGVPPATAPEAIPAGWYTAYMSKSEMKPAASNPNNAYLECEYTITAPAEYANRKLYDRINLQNQNQTTQEIAYRTLSAICHATGTIQVEDSAELHNKPLQVKVSLRPAGPGADGKHYEASNEVKGYKAVDAGGQPQAPAAGAMPPAAAAPKAAWTPPAAPAAPVAPAASWAPPPVAPAAPAAPQRPTDPTHIHAAGTPQEQWWVNGAWTPAPAQAVPAPVAPPAMPAPVAAPAPVAPAAPAPAAGQVPPWATAAA